MNIRNNLAKAEGQKIPGLFRRAFKPAANAVEQSRVDAELQTMAKCHRAVSLFAPTFKSWNR